MRRSTISLTLGLAFAVAACGSSDRTTAADVPETPLVTPTASATPTRSASASAAGTPDPSAAPSVTSSPSTASGLDPLVVPATATDLPTAGAWAAWPTREIVEGSDDDAVRALAKDAAISADGTRFAFKPTSTNTGCPYDTVVVGNLTNGRFECVVDDGAKGSFYGFALSGDGRSVAFLTDAKLSAERPPAEVTGFQLYAKNLATGEVEPVSRNADGTWGKGVYSGMRLSANGRTVAFSTSSRNLLPGGASGDRHVLVKNLDSGTLERASVSSTGMVLPSLPDVFDLSADGRKVAFVSVRGDTKDVLIRDLGARTTSRVWTGKGTIGRVSLSADGTKVAFVSRDAGPKTVYLADTAARKLQRVNLASDRFRDTGPEVSISGDGRTLVHSVRSGYVVVELATGKRKVLPGDGGYLAVRALSATGGVLIGLAFTTGKLEVWRR